MERHGPGFVEIPNLQRLSWNGAYIVANPQRGKAGLRSYRRNTIETGIHPQM